jgi:hypothetical protein
VNYNTADLAAKLLDSCIGGADQIVVVDNASPEEGIDLLAAQHPEVTVLRLPTNRGYGAGANSGAALCDGDVLIVSNADIEIDAAGMRRLAAVVARDDVAIAAPRFVDTSGTLIRSSHHREPGLLTTLFEQCGPFAAVCKRLRPEWHPTLDAVEGHGVDHDVSHVLGALMAIDRPTFQRLGGFDESFFLYREETDLCHRVRQGDGRVRHVASVTAVHAGDASTVPDGLLVASRSSAVRSHYLYLRKHRGWAPAALAWLMGLTGSVLWLILGRQRQSAVSSVRAHVELVKSR